MSKIKHDSYEHILMCLICRSLFDDCDHQPKFLPCHHTFCKECLREYVRQVGEEIECPSCKKVATMPAAGISALQTNFYVRYIRSLVYCTGSLGVLDNMGPDQPCQSHPDHLLQFYCQDCNLVRCERCKQEGGCMDHEHRMLACAIEQTQSCLDASFMRANDLIEKQKTQLEDLMKKLAEEKDRALLRIESTFESHVHALNRRATLLKNKVIDIYNDRVSKLESDMEEISTAMTCIVSLKEFHETSLSKGDLNDVDKGIKELDEIYTNVDSHIHPCASHVSFDDLYSLERFRSCVKDLGRVTCQFNPPSLLSPTTPHVLERNSIPVSQTETESHGANDFQTPDKADLPEKLGNANKCTSDLNGKTSKPSLSSIGNMGPRSQLVDVGSNANM